MKNRTQIDPAFQSILKAREARHLKEKEKKDALEEESRQNLKLM